MARNVGPKHTLCRRVGERLCTTDKCPVVRRPYPPGVHGPKKKRRQLSTYGSQFREKQKAKVIYGLLERQFRGVFEEAKRRAGNTSLALVQLLELRLDNVVHRLGLASTRSQARQLVSHGHLMVNGRRVTIPSYRVKPGDAITVHESSKSLKHFSEKIATALPKHAPPGWLALDAATMTGKVLAPPGQDEVQQNFDPTMIVEFYSR